jgi:hypothetical protein
MKLVRVSAVVLLVLTAAATARADKQARIDKAQEFFDAEERGKFMLGYLHLGGDYDSHKCIAAVDVEDADGNVIPGEFCLRYEFEWSIAGSDNTTTVDLIFDAKGRLAEVNNEKSTSIVSPPYLLANGAIKILGKALLEATKDNLKDEDKEFIQKCIDDAEAHDLMVFALKLQYNVLR